MTTYYIQIPQVGQSPYWANPASSAAALPAGTVDGEVAVATDTYSLYYWNANSSTWSLIPVNVSEIAGTLAVAHGGTGSAVAMSNNRVMKSSAGTIIEAAAITANRALASDSNGIPTNTATTDTELGYVSGVTSALQTQINGKQATGSYITALTGDVTAAGPGSVAATVATVGGSTAANVHSAELAANAATNANTASTIVKRDGSGNFTAGAVTATTVNATTSALVGASGSAATSTALEIQSTTGALLMPRMTTTQRNALTAVNGMVVYDSTINQFYGYANSAWTSLQGWGN